MQSNLLELIACPACNGSLKLEATESLGVEVVTGQLVCINCGQRYPIERRMPLLYVNDQRWKPKAREAIGWVGYHQKLGIYEQPEDAVDLKIPYYPEQPWIGVARHFDVALDLMKLTGQEVILDLGAGRGWAAKQFALKGCRAVAIDVVSDEQVGLGRSWALMENAHTRFEPIIGDSENLPFFPDLFDIVFCAAVLHHTSDLPGLLKSVYKVLKPGGRLVAVNEPCISMYEDQQMVLKRDAAEELAFGINETRPNYRDYMEALTGAGFTAVNICPIEVFGKDDATLENLAMQIGAIPPRIRQLTLRQLPRAVVKYFSWRIRSMKNWTAQLPHPETKRQALIQSILVNKGAGVVIVAQK